MSYDDISVEKAALLRTMIEEEQVKIEAALPMLTGSGWKDPKGKEAFIREVYNGRVPSHLCYAVSGIVHLTREDVEIITNLFWDVGRLNPGDIELCVATSSKGGTLLHIRKAQKFLPEVTLRDKKCPLYRTGDALQGSELCVVFPDLWNNEDLRS